MMLIKQLKDLLSQALNNCFGQHLQQQDLIIEVTPATKKQYGHYQCNSAMKISKILQQQPRNIAQAIIDNIWLLETQQPIKRFAQIEIAGPGFINFTLSTEYIEYCINLQLADPRQGVDLIAIPKKVVIDFSSPNIAKEMHVGHLRSTIIGDCLARMLSFVGHNVLRLNHIGDWGTQFGMLIVYLQDNFAEPLNTKLNLSQLQDCYRAAKIKFDNDLDFKTRSQQAVTKLQANDPETKKIWQEICYISSIGYKEIYNLLDIDLLDRGESFYNDLLPEIIQKIDQENIMSISDGAKCVFLDGYITRTGESLPLIIQKSDGGYNYATTDLAAIYHRTKIEQGEWLIYVVDAGQSQHLNMVFAAARKAKLCSDNVRLDHVPFGLVLGADGKKFRTRSGETEKLIDLINTAITQALGMLQSRNAELSNAELEDIAKKLGINAIKYADLSNNRVSDYTFSYERMLQFEGNTAAFLAYAYVRINSIKRKVANKTTADTTTKIVLTESYEIDLALHLCQFAENLQSAVNDLLPNRLCDYLFHLSEKFHVFFHHCRVENSEYEKSRLLLCTASAQVLQRGFELLGLQLLDKM